MSPIRAAVPCVGAAAVGCARTAGGERRDDHRGARGRLAPLHRCLRPGRWAVSQYASHVDGAAVAGGSVCTVGHRPRVRKERGSRVAPGMLHPRTARPSGTRLLPQTRCVSRRLGAVPAALRMRGISRRPPTGCGATPSGDVRCAATAGGPQVSGLTPGQAAGAACLQMWTTPLGRPACRGAGALRAARAQVRRLALGHDRGVRLVQGGAFASNLRHHVHGLAEIKA